MDGSSSDSDGPPRVPEEDPIPGVGSIPHSSLQQSTDARLRGRVPLAPSRGCKPAAPKRVQRCSSQQLPLKAGATQLADKRHPVGFSRGGLGVPNLAQRRLQDNTSVLRATPEALDFRVDCSDCTATEAVKPQWQDVVLQNVSDDTVSFAVLPPSSSAFSLSCSQRKSFLCAGMQQRLHICYNPSVCAPQSDFIRVVFSTRTPVSRGPANCSPPGSMKALCCQAALFQMSIALSATVSYNARLEFPEDSSSIADHAASAETDETKPASFPSVSSLDFGSIKMGAVVQRRIVLPAARWMPVEFSAELRRGSRAFSVKPEKGTIGLRAPVTLWIQFAPALYATYTTELRVYMRNAPVPYRIGLVGRGVPLDIALQPRAHPASMGQGTGDASGEATPATADSQGVCSREPEASKNVHSIQGAEGSLECELQSAHHEQEWMRPQEDLGASTSLQEAPSAQGPGGCASTSTRPEGVSPWQTCRARGENTSNNTSNATKRAEGSKGGDGGKTRQSLDQRWADLVAVLRAQKLGAHTVKGSTLPSAALLQRLQIKRSDDVRRMLRQMHQQDRMRSSCTSAGAPVAPSRAIPQTAHDSDIDAQEQQLQLKEQWKREVSRRVQQVTATLVIRARAARRLSLLRSWRRSHGTREEAPKELSQEKQQRREQQNSTKRQQVASKAFPRGTTGRQASLPTKTGKEDAGQDEHEMLRGLGGATQPVASGAKATAPGGSLVFPAAEEGNGEQDLIEEEEWKVKLVPPKLLLPRNRSGEIGEGDIPGPHFWGTEELQVTDLFSCLHEDTPLSPLPKRDVEVFRLKEADFVTCTGGLEITDADLLQSLLEAVPPLIQDKPWVPWLASEPQHLEGSPDVEPSRIGDPQLRNVLDCVSILPPEDPETVAEAAWRFIAPTPPNLRPLMPLPTLVETDLAHSFLQVRTLVTWGWLPWTNGLL